MAEPNRLGLLRKLLTALGLKEQAVDEIIDRIVELLSGPEKEAAGTLPYHLRDAFLTPAEHSFYMVLCKALEGAAGPARAIVFSKVSLGDVFYARSSDPSEFRTATNRIDRKHVDFLLCEPGTVRPLMGIELDDKSHARDDRQARDAFVDEVFETAGLPLMRVRVRREYAVAELRAELERRLGGARGTEGGGTAAGGTAAVGTAAVGTAEAELPQGEPSKAEASSPGTADEIPRCPKCGSPMVLRRARSGANAGGRFWGCTNYPRCRGVVRYKG